MKRKPTAPKHRPGEFQGILYRFLLDKDNWTPPAIPDVAKKFGMSKMAVYIHANKLVKKGLLDSKYRPK